MRCFTFHEGLWEGIRPSKGAIILGRRGEGCRQERIRLCRYHPPRFENEKVLNAGLKRIDSDALPFWVLESAGLRGSEFWTNRGGKYGVNRKMMSIRQVNAGGVLVLFRGKAWEIVQGEPSEVVEGWDVTHREVLIQFDTEGVLKIQTEKDEVVYLVYEVNTERDRFRVLDSEEFQSLNQANS